MFEPFHTWSANHSANSVLSVMSADSIPNSSTREVEQEKGHGKSGEMRPNHLAIPPEFGYDSQYWKEYVELAKDHDKEFITGLNAHLDSLLTFAGLFSSVNTGFIVLCLGLLDKTPSDKTNALIRILISQTTNVTREELDRASEEWDLEPAGYLTSAFLSASLSCGLIAGMGAVLGKQWLSYYEKTGQTGTLDERAVKLQNKMDKVDAYSFRTFLFSLSVLIQIALFLFLIGFIIYLHDLNPHVAFIVMVLVGLGFIIYAYTVVTAALDPECPFQTPVSMALRSLLRFIPIITQFVTERLSSTLAHSCSSGKPYRSIIRAKTSSKLDVFKRGRSYARSVRWILETTSHQGALLEAARNIPALQDIKSTRRIFERPDTAILQRMSQYTGNLLSLSKKSQTSSSLLSHPDDSLAYSRLVSLYRGSLARYLTQQCPQRASKVILNEAVVYGRALCHALITSTGAQEAFEHLSQHLGDFASLAWMDGIDGELRLLLMCTLNHPRFWLYPELVESSFHSIDITTLPMYIVGISIVSLASSASDRTTWVNRLVHWSLSRDNSSPRVLGVAAKALSHNGGSDVKSMLNDFWSAYPSGDQYLSYVLEALQRYPSGPEIVPDCIEAYSALVKALRVEISDLDTTRDDFYPLDIQARRRKIRANVKDKLGRQILKALEDILIKITDLIKSPPRPGDTTGISFPHPTFGENHLLQDNKGARPFIHEILHAVNIGLENYRWGDAATPSGLAFWKVGEVVENNSESLRILLEIMSKTAEETDQYSSLFRDSPSVAPCIIAALNSNVAEVRANALLLIGRKAQQWFEDPFINESFLIHKFDEYLIWHLKFGDTPHRSIKSLVAKLESKLEWRTRLYKAFHELALSSRYESSEGDPADLVGLSLDIWRALSVSPVGPEMDAITASFNWYSDEMVSKVTEYVLHRVRSLKLGGAYDAELTKNAGISESLRVYVKHLNDAQTARQTPTVQALLQGMQQLEELIDPNASHYKGSRSH